MISRRAFLACGAGLILAACTPNPRIELPNEPSPSLEQPRQQSAQTLANLAAICTWIAQSSSDSWFADLSSMFTAQQQVFLQRNPLGGTQADPSPLSEISLSPVNFSSPDDALATFSSQVETAVSQWRDLAKQQSDISMGLLWASIATSTAVSSWATTQLSNRASTNPNGTLPTPIEPMETVDALELVLEQYHVLIWTIEAMKSVVSDTDPRAKQLADRLGSAMKERDEISSLISDRGGLASAAKAEYSLASNPKDISSQESLWASLESRIAQSFTSVFTSTTTDPTLTDWVLDGMARGWRNALTHQAALPYWVAWV